MKSAREQAEEIWRKWKDVPQGSIVCHEHARDWWVKSITAALEEKGREIERLKNACSKEFSAVEELNNENIVMRVQLAEAVKLLEPFAKEVAYKPHHCAAFPDEASPNFVTLGHCRAAAAFVAKHKVQP